MANKKSKAVSAEIDADAEWKAEHDLRTLIDAEKIQADEKRLKAAMAKREEQMAALKKIKG